MPVSCLLATGKVRDNLVKVTSKLNDTDIVEEAGKVKDNLGKVKDNLDKVKDNVARASLPVEDEMIGISIQMKKELFLLLTIIW